ncbi:MAG: bifunctional UDP-N-acetylglucosamine diphosphorylase/glucosamine-1-phosphate N-acetyltransferase GlmU [Thermovirgaceae bacterium]
MRGKGTGALVLAAGKGTRMKSETPKVLLPILEEPLLWYVLANLSAAPVDCKAVVVGHGRDIVGEYLQETWPEAAVCVQENQNGTGHAVMCSREWLSGLEHVLVVPGDVPQLSGESTRRLLEEHSAGGFACTFFGFRPEDPAGYGRVIEKNGVVRIVEDRDATEEEKKTPVANSGIYVFRVRELLECLEGLGKDNAQGEYYLTDVVEFLSREGEAVKMILLDDANEVSGVNDPLQLAEATRRIRDSILEKHMKAGVRCVDPQTVYFGPRVRIDEDVLIDPFVQIYGGSVIGRGCRIGSHSTLHDVQCAAGVDIRGHVDVRESSLATGSVVGPFAHIRNGSEIGENAYIGKFVEIKNSRIGSCAKVPHLSYMGDAEIGERSNVGAGTITCNYDGEKKHRTRVGSDCFIGSDTMLVAPVEMGNHSYTGAGSVITKNVPEGSLAVARSRQTNIEGWAQRKKKQGGQS